MTAPMGMRLRLVAAAMLAATCSERADQRPTAHFKAAVSVEVFDCFPRKSRCPSSTTPRAVIDAAKFRAAVAPAIYEREVYNSKGTFLLRVRVADGSTHHYALMYGGSQIRALNDAGSWHFPEGTGAAFY